MESGENRQRLGIPGNTTRYPERVGLVPSFDSVPSSHGGVDPVICGDVVCLHRDGWAHVKLPDSGGQSAGR